MLLTIDRGNTSLDAMLHTDPPQRWRSRAADPAVVLAAVGAVGPVRAVGSTVVDGGLDAVAARLLDNGVRLEIAGRDLPCPLAVAYSDPSSLGTDRWLSALAAFALYGESIVVQCGTAVTVDAVDANGRFLGGTIAPGLHAMGNGLASAAPRLPRFADHWVAGAVIQAPATTSEACVAAGVLLAFCGAVERLVETVSGAISGAAARVVTGGDADVYLRHATVSLAHVPDLLHQGLRCLARTCGPSS